MLNTKIIAQRTFAEQKEIDQFMSFGHYDNGVYHVYGNLNQIADRINRGLRIEFADLAPLLFHHAKNVSQHGADILELSIKKHNIIIDWSAIEDVLTLEPVEIPELNDLIHSVFNVFQMKLNLITQLHRLGLNESITIKPSLLTKAARFNKDYANSLPWFEIKDYVSKLNEAIFLAMIDLGFIRED